MQGYKKDPAIYFGFVEDFLTKTTGRFTLFRWHASGDIVDYNYLLNMITVSNKFPDIKFLCFTKKFEIVNKYLLEEKQLPKNLKVVFSAWDKNFIVDNPNNLPVTYVNFKDKTRNPDIPETAIPCTGSCPSCGACWTLTPGQAVVFAQH